MTFLFPSLNWRLQDCKPTREVRTSTKLKHPIKISTRVQRQARSPSTMGTPTRSLPISRSRVTTPNIAKNPVKTPNIIGSSVRTPTMARRLIITYPLVIVGLWMLALSLPTSVEGVITCGKCENGTSLTCPNSLDMQFKVSFSGAKYLHLQCNNSAIQLDFTMLESCSFPSITQVKIKQCPLFNESLASVLTNIGVNVNEILSLFWESSHSVEGGLQKWHLDNLPNVTQLQIHYNGFQSYPEEFLKNVPLLRSLYLSGNNNTQLPDDFLSYTPRIAKLDLGNHNLKSVSETLLQNMSVLESLNLWTDDLSNIPARFLSKNPQLTQVTMSGNKITSLHPQLFQNLTKLTAVDIQYNNLETLPELMFQGCSKLTNVSIQYSILSSLPTNMFRGTVVSILHLGYNKLTNVNGSLRDLPTLQNVTLRNNTFRKLDSGMFLGSPNIVFLDMQANAIEKIDEGIFDDLSKLRVVILSWNSLEKLPAELFKNCISLMQVFLQENKLITLPTDTFPYSSAIKKVNLSGNMLTLTKEIINPFNKLTGIEELYLSNNKISVIFTDALRIFAELRVFDLRNNVINSLTDSDLAFVSNNVTLLLQGNNISDIQTSQFLGYGKTDYYISVSLAGNPINCNCKMYDFLSAAQMEPPFVAKPYTLIVRDAQETFCIEPEKYSKVRLSSVDKSNVVCETKCSLECTCNFRPADRFIMMDCSNLGLSHPPTFTEPFKSCNGLNLSLDLSSNDIDDVDFLQNLEYKKLVNLNLANNSVATINETYLPDSLKYMDLRDNNFTMMPQDLVDHLNASGMTLYLGGNPWSCDCGLKSFHDFIRNNYELVRDRQAVVCRDGGAPVDKLLPEQLCPFLANPGTLAIISVSIFLLLLFAVLLTATWYRHKEMVKVWLYSHKMCLWAVTEHEIDADKKYDVFISYSYKDENFVDKILVPELENGDPPYQVCLHYRDWIPGEFIHDQIMTSVRESRRTIIVLSKNFLEGVWTQLEFKAANSQALKDKTNRIIVIVHGEVPSADELDGELKHYVHTNTYIKWGDQRFWERLRYAMPHAKYVRRRNAKVADKLEMVKPAPKSATKTLED